MPWIAIETSPSALQTVTTTFIVITVLRLDAVRGGMSLVTAATSTDHHLEAMDTSSVHSGIIFLKTIFFYTLISKYAPCKSYFSFMEVQLKLHVLPCG